MKQLQNFLLKTHIDITMLRLGLIIVFGVFGIYKWFDFEAQALAVLTNGTWLGILYSQLGPRNATYLLGVVENIALIALIVGYFNASIGIIGDCLVILTGLVTLSLLPQLGRIDSFILKDVLLVGGGLVLLKYDLLRKKPSALCNLA